MGLLTINVSRVKVLGIRTAIQSKAFSDVNFGIYTLLVEYKDGHREIVEVDKVSALQKYANFIDMD
jgi:hypothetical protein